MTSYYNQHQEQQPAITVKLHGPSVGPVVLTKAAKQLLPHDPVESEVCAGRVVVIDLQPLAIQESFEPFVSAHEPKQIGPLIARLHTKERRVYLRTTPQYSKRSNGRVLRLLQQCVEEDMRIRDSINCVPTSIDKPKCNYLGSQFWLDRKFQDILNGISCPLQVVQSLRFES